LALFGGHASRPYNKTRISLNSTWLVTSRLDTTRHVRRVEPMYFGCVELVEQHGSTRSTRLARLARHVERVESCRDVTSHVEFWAIYLLYYAHIFRSTWIV